MRLVNNVYKFLLLTFGCNHLAAQNCWQLHIFAPDGKPIANATVVVEQNTVLQSDADGNITLCNTHNKQLTALVEARGFVSRQVLVDSAYYNILLDHQNRVIADVTVIAEKNIQQKSSVSTVLIGKQEIEEQQPQQVAELLQTKSGFSQRIGYQTPITLRGLSGRSLLMLRNGDRRFSSYPAGFMTHVVNMYELERIEIERGAASVAYGEGAIAGIVNLIDKSPFEGKKVEAKVTTSYASNNDEYSIVSSTRITGNNLGFRMGLNYRKANEFRYADGSKADNSFYTDGNAFFTAGYRNGSHEILMNNDFHYGGPWGKPRGFNGSKYMLYKTLLESNKNVALHYSYTKRGVLRQLKLSLYTASEKRNVERRYFTAAGNYLSFKEITFYSDYYYGTKLQVCFLLHPKITVRCGAEAYHFTISTPVESIDYMYGLEFQNKISQNANSQTVGSYMENEYLPTSKLRIITGIRYDAARINEGDAYVSATHPQQQSVITALTGNLSARWQLSAATTVKCNLARAFAMPQPTELFADNYTANGIVFCNPNLKAEHGYSVDWICTFATRRCMVEISPYVWILNNMISRLPLKGQIGTNYQYANIGKARLWGGEVLCSVPCDSVFSSGDRIAASIALAYCNGNDQSESNSFFTGGIPLDYIPPLNSRVECSYHSPSSKKICFNLGIDCSYYSKQTRKPTAGYATPEYVVFGCSTGLTAQYLPLKPTLRITMSNLANRQYFSYQSFLPSPGRNVKFSFSIAL